MFWSSRGVVFPFRRASWGRDEDESPLRIRMAHNINIFREFSRNLLYRYMYRHSLRGCVMSWHSLNNIYIILKTKVCIFSAIFSNPPPAELAWRAWHNWSLILPRCLGTNPVLSNIIVIIAPFEGHRKNQYSRTVWSSIVIFRGLSVH